ncbi:hypothetical protein BGZ67_000103 [Mortierella alpina]|nr:hypothetical protein BGZ67_000103 [Mortierella alpina]
MSDFIGIYQTDLFRRMCFHSVDPRPLVPVASIVHNCNAISEGYFMTNQLKRHITVDNWDIETTGSLSGFSRQ